MSSQEKFPHRLRERSHIASMNSGLSPLDSLIYVINLKRQLQEAFTAQNLKRGTALLKFDSQVTYTADQAQAAVDDLPQEQKIALYNEQIDRIEDQISKQPDSTKPLPYSEEDLSKYRKIIAELTDNSAA